MLFLWYRRDRTQRNCSSDLNHLFHLERFMADTASPPWSSNHCPIPRRPGKAPRQAAGARLPAVAPMSCRCPEVSMHACWKGPTHAEVPSQPGTPMLVHPKRCKPISHRLLPLVVSSPVFRESPGALAIPFHDPDILLQHAEEESRFPDVDPAGSFIAPIVPTEYQEPSSQVPRYRHHQARWETDLRRG